MEEEQKSERFKRRTREEDPPKKARPAKRAARTEPDQPEVTKEAAPIAPAPLPSGRPPIKRVRLVNLRGQLVSCSVLGEDGRVKEVRLQPHGSSDPVPEDCLTAQAAQLVSQNYLKIESA